MVAPIIEVNYDRLAEMTAGFGRNAERYLRCFVLCSVLLASLFAVTACKGNSAMNTSLAADDSMNQFVNPISEDQLAAFIGQPFPAAATGVAFAGEAALDTLVIARFSLPQDQVEAYLTSLGVTTPLDATYTPFFSDSAPYEQAASWWTPVSDSGKAASARGVYQQVGEKHYKILVLEDGSGMGTIYMQVYNV